MYPRSRRCPLPDARPSPLALLIAFGRLGAVAFGGLGAALALLERDLVARRGWLRGEDLAAALAFTKPLPGSTVVQVVAFLGWRLGGWPGAVAAAVAFLLPSLALMVAGAALLTSLPGGRILDGALLGVQVAVVGLLAVALARLVADVPRGPLRLLSLAALAAGLLAVNAALIVVAGGLVAMGLRRG